MPDTNANQGGKPAQNEPRGPVKPPRARGGVRSFALAVLMHGLLAALLLVGIKWRTSEEPAAVSAELWTPPPVAQVEPKPQPRPEPKPEPKPEPPPPPPPPPPPVETPKPPDIAIEQERKRKEEEAKRADDEARRAAAEKARREAEEKRKEEEAKKLAADKARKEEEAKKAAAEKAKKEAEEKRLAEEKRKEEEAKKAAADKAKKEAEEKRLAEEKRKEEEARREAAKQREADMQRLLAQDGAASRASSGTAAAGGGAGDATYRGLLSALIKDAIVEPQGLSGNPRATFEVRIGQPSPIVSADGRDCPITSVSLKRSSGVRVWDEAAERGIRKSGPWPRRPNGDCPVGLHEINPGLRD